MATRGVWGTDMMSGPTESFEKSQVEDGATTLLKTVEKKQDGLVISYSIVSEHDSPVAVRIRDPLPELSIEDKGFHPDHRPRNWGIEKEALLFDEVVRADEETYVVFGIVTVGEDDVRMEFEDPTIESMQPLDADEADAISADAGNPVFRKGTLDNSPETQSSGFSLGKSNERRSGPSSAGSQRGENGLGTDDSGGANDSGESPHGGENSSIDTVPTTDDAAPGVGEADAGDAIASDGSEGRESDREKPGREAPEETSSSTADELDFGPENTGAKSSREATSSTVDESRAGQEDHPGSGPPASSDDGAMVDAFLDRLEREALTDEQLDRIREQLGLDNSRALEVRVRHLESEIGNFSAYVSALEELINEHGDASEFVSEIYEQIDELRGDIEGQRREFENVKSERTDVQNHLGELDNALSALQKRLDEDIERTETYLGERISHLNDELDETTEKIEAHETKLERFDSRLTDEAEAVRDEIAAVDQRFENRYDDIEDELAQLESEIEEVGETAEERAESVRQQVESVEERVTSVKRSHEDDIERLAGQVSDLEEMRDVFVEAFGEVGQDDDAGDGGEQPMERDS